jgi:hypothetical protein
MIALAKLLKAYRSCDYSSINAKDLKELVERKFLHSTTANRLAIQFRIRG